MLKQGCFYLPFDCGKVRGYSLDKSAFLKIVDVTASLSRMEDETEGGRKSQFRIEIGGS